MLNDLFLLAYSKWQRYNYLNLGDREAQEALV